MDTNSFLFCEETVALLMERFSGSNISLAEEISEITATIDNEKLWVKGSLNKEEVCMHLQNIADLTEYRDRLKARAA